MVSCPKCQSENTTEFGADEPNTMQGMIRKYRAYDCADCGCFFRVPVEVV